MKINSFQINILFISIYLVAADNSVTHLEPNLIVDYAPVVRRAGFIKTELRIYCYHGAEKTLPRLFESIELHFDIADDDYRQYEGVTPEEVRKHYDEQRSLFSFNIFTQKRTRLQLSPFGQHCIGMETTQAYRVKLQQIRVDFWRVIQITLGILLFANAGRLSNNSAFFYLAGIAIGICSSFMLLIWLAGKLVPKRPVMYGVVIGGWAVGAYLLQMLWDNIQLILVTYKTYVFWYILITGMISFLFCYRWGPPKNPRSKNIIKWTLQFFGLICIYLSSYFEEATVAIMLLTILALYFPKSLTRRLHAIYLRRFPPKRRLLTNEEYYEEGVRETTKALDELRKFASSPDCRQWKLMSQLKDPRRFASFVEGASHLRDEEILDYEGSVMDADENDSDEDTDESANVQFNNVLDNDISEEEDEANYGTANLERQRRNEMQPTCSPMVNGAIRGNRDYATYSRYASTYANSYANVYESRAAQIPRYSIGTRSRQQLAHSDSDD